MRRRLQPITDDRTITTAIHFLKDPFTLADAERLIRDLVPGVDCFFGAFRLSTKELVGVVGAGMRHDDQIEVGYWIGTAFQGNGYGEEVVGAVINLLRSQFPGRQIVAECRMENDPSRRLLKKLKFLPTGEVGQRPNRDLFILSC
jgi:RimJ/RimL family protein N-acetyltransferase